MLDKPTELPLEGQADKACEQCGKQFERRKHGGGSPQRFCRGECRIEWHAAQRNPACATLPTKIDPPPSEKPDEAPESESEFDWSDTECLALSEQYATACYFNKAGELIIRQKRWPDDDTCIVIAADQLNQFIDKLTDIIGIPSFGK